MQVSLIRPNPNNPRIIKKDKFDKLVKSIKQFPEMLEARPLILNKDNIVLGGNMRLKALQKAGITDVPVIHVDWDADKESEFIIKDNLSYGEWDYDIIANEWDVIKLDDWGFDLPVNTELDAIDDVESVQNELNEFTIKITFEHAEHLQHAEIDIQELIDRKYKGAKMAININGI